MSLTDSANRAVRWIQCPICLDVFPWPDDQTCWFYSEEDGKYERVDLTNVSGPKRADLLRMGYVPCPNPSADSNPHFLPATYGAYSDPVIIAMVGDVMSGKTHLLVSMVSELLRGGLTRLGSALAPLDFHHHNQFKRALLTPFESGQELPETNRGVGATYACAFLVRSPTRQTPLIFFDVAGEDLSHSPRSSRFIVAANGLIFTCEGEVASTDRRIEDPTVSTAIERLRAAGLADDVSAAVVMTKADRQRFAYPVRNWLERGQELRLDPARIRAESRDVYAYLHNHGRISSLAPIEAFRRCTLHFASATGGDPSPDGTLARGVRPMRVLEPLISILAMTGVIEGDAAERVGY